MGQIRGCRLVESKTKINDPLATLPRVTASVCVSYGGIRVPYRKSGTNAAELAKLQYCSLLHTLLHRQRVLYKRL